MFRGKVFYTLKNNNTIMIELKFDTLNHSLEYTYDHITRT